LRGKAREVLDNLPAETATKDYDELKRALLARFQLTADTYRVKFRTARKEKEESFPQFAVRLELWLRRWMTLSSRAETFEDLRDLVLQEQLLDAMTPELATHVREREPKSVGDAAKLADVYV
jgi:hypothetical protein